MAAIKALFAQAGSMDARATIAAILLATGLVTKVASPARHANASVESVVALTMATAPKGAALSHWSADVATQHLQAAHPCCSACFLGLCSLRLGFLSTLSNSLREVCGRNFSLCCKFGCILCHHLQPAEQRGLLECAMLAKPS
jgi:hypothetical protein